MKKSKPFSGLRCPHCGETDSLKVDVETVGLECSACSESVSKGDVEKLLATWTKLYSWLESVENFA